MIERLAPIRALLKCLQRSLGGCSIAAFESQDPATETTLRCIHVLRIAASKSRTWQFVQHDANKQGDQG